MWSATPPTIPKNYTSYQANTSFANVNQVPTLNQPPTAQSVTFDTATQTFSPQRNNAVLENQTGGENQPSGPGNVLGVGTRYAVPNMLTGSVPAQPSRTKR